MKYINLLLICGFCISLSSTAQKTVAKAYAITSATKGGFVWTEVKLIDMNTGEVLENIFENKKGLYNVFDARSGNEIKVKKAEELFSVNNKIPFPSFSAACAYDKKHHRLYYTPMFLNQLRFIDLSAKTPRIFYFENEPFSNVENLNKEENHITRMVIAADGNGYALSNDSRHLVRFTTGKKPVISDLGPVNDDPLNKNISIRDKCTSWGGDMIADASGNLYVISAYRSVFKIDIDNRKATYVSNIVGVPANFTTNGAVIDNEGNLIVTSAVSAEGYYKVDMNTWKATRIETTDQVFNASDLANGNLAFQNQAQIKVPDLLNRSFIRNSEIAVYPNPVTKGIFRVSFDTHQIGSYEIQLVDLSGRILSNKIINVNNKEQVEEIDISPRLANGIYMVKVLNNRKKMVYTDKIIVK